jgi:rhamnulokinase
MSNTATVLAFDFGASSGRAIRAVYDGQNLTYEEIHRFENVPIEKDGHLCWDVETLLKEIHTAIQKAGTFDSLGFDTWGVDFGLLDTDGHLLANPVHYRDARTNGKPEQAAARMPAEELYAHTGNQIFVPAAGSAGAGSGTAAKGRANPFYAGSVRSSVGGRAGL